MNKALHPAPVGVNFRDAQLCAGFGARDTLKDREGAHYSGIRFTEIVELAANPQELDKTAALWVIPSDYREADARVHAAQSEQGRFWMLPLDLDAGNPALDVAMKLVREVIGEGPTLVGYSTHGSTPEVPKSRVLVALSEPVAGADWRLTVDAYNDLLETASSGLLIPDERMRLTGQVLFLPNRGSHYQYLIDPAGPPVALVLDEGHPLSIRREQLRTIEDEVQQSLSQRAVARMKQAGKLGQGKDVIGAFNAGHRIEDLLRRYGYEQRGPRSPHWRSPHQTSDSYATRVIEDEFGQHWWSLSGSDMKAGLGAKSRSGDVLHGDAFDLFVYYEHGGKFGTAVRAYATVMGLGLGLGPKAAPEITDDKRHAVKEMTQGKKTAAGEDESRTVSDEDGPRAQGEDAEPDSGTTDSEFEFIAVGDLEYREPEYVVGDLIETESLGLIFGDPGGGKSFLAIDMALCVATGTPFHGREVKKGPVIMIAGEGHNGLARRFAAWAKDKGRKLSRTPMYVSRRAGQFLDQASATSVCNAVDKLAKRHGNPRLIIVDTVARNFGAGDENSTMEMGMFVAAMDEMKVRYPGSTVMLVHHSGHAEKSRARGAIALKAALDFEYRAEKDGQHITVINTKMKDAPQPPDLHFILESVQLEGKATGAVLRSSEAPPRTVTHTPTQKLALATYEDAARVHGIWTEGEDGTETFAGVHVKNWRDAFYPKHTGDSAAGKRQAFHRARAELVQLDEMRVENDVYVSTSHTIHGMLRAARMIQRDGRDKA